MKTIDSKQLVDKSLIQKYAKRNTSAMMPIESRYVEAFIDSTLNSDAVIAEYEKLFSIMHNDDSFILINSLHENCKSLNYEPLRSIIGYSLNRKDMLLFKMISLALFKGEVNQYYGQKLLESIMLTTDESPIKTTDTGGFTDALSENPLIDFNNSYCYEDIDDEVFGHITEYAQTKEQVIKASEIFDKLITVVKPARISVLLRYNYNVFLGAYIKNDTLTTLYSGIDIIKTGFKSKEVVENLMKLSISELLELYKPSGLKVYDYENSEVKEYSCERFVYREDNFIEFEYNIRARFDEYAKEDDVLISPFGKITINPNGSYIDYNKSESYENGKEYFQKYEPVYLGFGDGSGNVLSFDGTENKVGLFYVRERN